MNTDDADSGDLPKAKDFLSRVRDSLKAPPPELEGRAPADIRAYLLVIACLMFDIVGAWLVVNNNLYVHRYHSGYQVLSGWSGILAGSLAMGLGWHAAHTYKPHLIIEIPAWAGFGIGLIEVFWLAGPILHLLGPGAG